MHFGPVQAAPPRPPPPPRPPLPLLLLRRRLHRGRGAGHDACPRVLQQQLQALVLALGLGRGLETVVYLRDRWILCCITRTRSTSITTITTNSFTIITITTSSSSSSSSKEVPKATLARTATCWALLICPLPPLLRPLALLLPLGLTQVPVPVLVLEQLGRQQQLASLALVVSLPLPGAALVVLVVATVPGHWAYPLNPTAGSYSRLWQGLCRRRRPFRTSLQPRHPGSVPAPLPPLPPLLPLPLRLRVHSLGPCLRPARLHPPPLLPPLPLLLQLLQLLLRRARARGYRACRPLLLLRLRSLLLLLPSRHPLQQLLPPLPAAAGAQVPTPLLRLRLRQPWPLLRGQRGAARRQVPSLCL